MKIADVAYAILTTIVALCALVLVAGYFLAAVR